MTGDNETHYDAYLHSQHRADRLVIDRLEAENRELRQVVAQQSARLEQQARTLAAVREACNDPYVGPPTDYGRGFKYGYNDAVGLVLRALDGGDE